jgi:ribose-phosphate pyrophosphokinase
VFPSQRHTGRGFRNVPDLTQGEFSVGRFANGELHVELGAPVAGIRCLVLGTIAPPERNLLSYLLLCHTLRKEGAEGIVAVLPYLAYARQDKREPLGGFGAAWVAELLGAAGVGAVVTVDVHSPHLGPLFPMPLVSLSPAPIFAQEIRRRSLLEATVVAPDQGAVDRCRAVAREAKMNGSVAFMTKQRTGRGVVHGGLQGSVGRRAVVIDDILDTGGTMISCCRELRRQGARELYVFVTHGLFTGDAWSKLWGLGVKLLGCTDTIPVRSAAARNITVLSASSLVVRGAMETRPVPAPPPP